MKKILVYVLFALCAISIGYFVLIIVNSKQHSNQQYYNESDNTTAETNIPKTSNTSTVTDASVTAKLASKTDAEKKEPPSSYDITMEYVSQYPDLPSGCESVSLTMLLNYNGFKITKNELVDNYLIYSYDYVNGFCGDPYSSYVGGGCYAPGMTDTANGYLKSQKSKLTAKNISGTDFDDLFKYIANDKPVMVWTTICLGGCEKGYEGGTYNGEYYAWDYMEHCVVLTGYDKINHTVTVYDPIDGIIKRDYFVFKDIYEQMYKMAIVIE